MATFNKADEKDNTTPSPSAINANKEALQSCSDLKERYDRCFNKWYRYNFLRGNLVNNCNDFFDDYRACISEELHKKGLSNLLLEHTPAPEHTKSPQEPSSST